MQAGQPQIAHTLHSSKMSSYLSLMVSLATLEHREGPMEGNICPAAQNEGGRDKADWVGGEGEGNLHRVNYLTNEENRRESRVVDYLRTAELSGSE